MLTILEGQLLKRYRPWLSLPLSLKDNPPSYRIERVECTMMGAFSEDAPEAKASLPSASLLQLVDKIPAVLWTTNPDLRLTSLVGAGLAAMNVRPEDYVGMCLSDFLPCPEPDTTPFVAHRQALRGEAFTFDIEMAGREFEAHVEPLGGPKGDIVGVIGVALDDTERRVAERALRLSEESYRLCLSEIRKGLSGRKLYFSPNSIHAHCSGRTFRQPAFARPLPSRPPT
jgi:PAS domain-containing protein